MIVAVIKETFPGEHRVSLIPGSVSTLTKAGYEVIVQAGAGEAAGYADSEYEQEGARIVATAQEAYQADVLLQVRALGANPSHAAAECEFLRPGQCLIASCDPLGSAEALQSACRSGASVFSLEMIPRITRAQSMDVLSSQATIAGYRAVLLAATHLPKMFPLMMTAAGTLTPARVFVIGAGVAGLQAIATAKRLGAVVRAYDVRPAVREQVESLGGKFVELELEASASEDKGGYAKAMGDEFYRRQRELMAQVVAESDVVITTAAIPGKPSPLLITADAVKGMHAGSVIVDLATERGGNCELSEADQTVVKHGVMIMGPTNLPTDVPTHASQMLSKNVCNFIQNMTKDGTLQVDSDDEIVVGTRVVHQGDVAHPRVREILSLPPLEPATATDEAGSNTPPAQNS
ncbi:MAG: Re/Si-specific NAD(P)(+) transhydrogenase subunit alpha [Planctomycetales bacterium]|nr:Re/Si-specific NAD(P)(+) transhydrogenase subunit alpha [Planctomycetales bacterium]